jgi:hypothetical protein
MLLVTIEKFEANSMLVNVNKLKPYVHGIWSLRTITTNANILGTKCRLSSCGEL